MARITAEAAIAMSPEDFADSVRSALGASGAMKGLEEIGIFANPESKNVEVTITWRDLDTAKSNFDTMTKIVETACCEGNIVGKPKFLTSI